MKIGPQTSPKRPPKSAKTHLASAKPWRGCRESRQQHGRPALLHGRPAPLSGASRILLQPPSLSPGELSCQNVSVRRLYACFLSSQTLFSNFLHPTLVVSGNPLPSLAYINPPYSPFKSTPNLLEKFSKRIILSLSLELGFKLSNPSSSKEAVNIRGLLIV